jgi:hypothetical protein
MLALLAATALAAPLPHVEGPVGAGTTVRIVDVSPKDAYRSDRRAWIGRRCVTTQALTEQRRGWYSGELACDADAPFFFEVRLLVTGVAPTPQSATAGSTPRHTGPIPKRSHVLITDIGPEDAYHDDRERLIGLDCVVPRAPSEHDDGWYSGPADPCSDGSSRYFYAAALTPIPGPLLRRGTTVVVTEAPGGDLVGQGCVVATRLKRSADGTYAGRLTCDADASVAVQGVKVALP